VIVCNIAIRGKKNPTHQDPIGIAIYKRLKDDIRKTRVTWTASWAKDALSLSDKAIGRLCKDLNLTAYLKPAAVKEAQAASPYPAKRAMLVLK
jgi:hypothetical protein